MCICALAVNAMQCWWLPSTVQGDRCVRLAFSLALGIPYLARIVIRPPHLVAKRLGAPCLLRASIGIASRPFG